MSNTPILGAPELAASQALPESTVNEAVRYLEQGAAWFRFIDRDDTAPPGSPADGDCYLVAATATGAWAGHDGEIAFYMSTAWGFITPAEGMAAYILDEDIAVAFDGAAWSEIGGGGTAAPHTVGMFFTTTPTANEVLLRYEFAEGVNYADDFAGSRASVGTNPTASFALTVNKNGSPIGTITIGTGGTITFATTGGAESFADDDLLTITAPGTPDATVANVAITLKGTRA